MLLLYLNIFIGSFFATNSTEAVETKRIDLGVIEACDSSRHIEAVEVVLPQVVVSQVAKAKNFKAGVALLSESKFVTPNLLNNSFSTQSFSHPLVDRVLQFCNLRL